MMLVLGLLLACERPAALPETAVDTRPPAVGRLVEAGPVRGFLARPGAESPPTPAELLLVEALDADAKAAAIEIAEAGGVALAIPPGVDLDKARAYLAGMPSTGPLTERCLRSHCP